MQANSIKYYLESLFSSTPGNTAKRDFITRSVPKWEDLSDSIDCYSSTGHGIPKLRKNAKYLSFDAIYGDWFYCSCKCANRTKITREEYEQAIIQYKLTL